MLVKESVSNFPYDFIARAPYDDSHELEAILDYGDHGHVFGDWTFLPTTGDDHSLIRYRVFFKTPTDLLFARIILENA